MKQLIVNVDDFGDLRFHESIAAGFAAGFLSSTSVLIHAESEAQFERFVSLVGDVRTNLDSHHHITVKRWLAKVLAPLHAVRGLPVQTAFSEISRTCASKNRIGRHRDRKLLHLLGRC